MRSIAWNMLSNLGVSLAAAVLACTAIKAMAQFVILPEVQVSSSEIVDFEFDYARDGVYCPSCNFGDGNSRFTFTDREYNLWLGYVDFQTGEFYPTNGHARLLDKRASFATDFGNGPEWMFSTRGSEIVYTKYSPGKPMNTLSASVAIASMIGGSWRAGIVDNGIRKQSPVATLDLDDPEPCINYQDFAKKKVYWRVAHDPGTEALVPITGGGASRRWVPGTHKVIFSDSAAPNANGVIYSQIFVFDTDSNKLEQLTFDPVNKVGAFMWRAPEYNNEFIFFTMLGRKSTTVFEITSIGIYRQLPDANGAKRWILVNLIAMPSDLPYIWSPEPFVHNGRSYIFFVVSSSPNATDLSVPTQIAITGIDPLKPSFRMLTNDSINERVRVDPEYFITANGPFIYYFRYIPSTPRRKAVNDGVWRVDTKLGPPMVTTTP